ncbi:structural maintenance of chromosomes 5 smc5 [Aspergillus nomiae NRRL 13137]|uniref:Structural maintenance of chromosomes protein 5 n=1 Tax=Aspergillus nomiae NRRL (strain ATCC 15546 / NRRL 13137 / CBS 260.88 / M93) TaxID=1509407 RepID=A0A0L1J430_ASPN3|nr:structural maintenance of chromosomes 5 smc5 [Aspergillus nomiae NRRL 13137]KNG86566.1 structural maintenance of chromosomes 5 smc5 [Aspergillus nomiae NRRL 13137]
MPSLATVPRRRQRSEEEESDDSTSSAGNPTPASSSSKRMRLEAHDEQDTEDTGSGTSDEEDEDSDNVNGTSKLSKIAKRRSPQLTQNGDHNGAAAQDGYKPGAIVRIKVTDFVTYTSAEFFPGPKLNMVIGPNGTGKSTLVCAICLGLGWGPAHLGRAKEPGEFVKHGCREATIEIELAGGPRFRRNPVVTRTIKRDGNKSSFTINGKAASRTQVLKLAQSFSIQIDNLCQFLPQDKVSEFAALTPIELLNSTQRAAAGGEMIAWHDNLKELRAQQKKLQADNKGDRDLLANLEGRQEMQRADVERMRQRAEIKRKIEMLELARPMAKYRAMHVEFKELKRRKEGLALELENLKAELEPALRAVNAKQRYCLQVDEVVSYKKARVEEAERTASELGKKIEQYEERMKDLDREIESEKRSNAHSKQEGTKIQQTINKLNRQLAEEAIEFDADWYNEKIREKRRQMRETEEKANEIKDRRRPLFEALKEKTDKVKESEQHLQRLDSQSGRQEEKLKQLSYETYKAYQWIQQNQDKFEKEVFGPPVVTCSVKDAKYADALESLFQRTDLMAFTVQCRNDFRTLQRELNIGQKLHDISIRTSSVPLERFRPPMSEDEVRSLGFDGWAKDLINGPDPVIASLCSENRLNQTPIGHRDITDEEFRRMEQGSISSWVAGKKSYTISRRKEYGPNATSTRVRQVRPARVWTSQPMDASAKQDLVQNIQALKEEVRELQEKIDMERANLVQLGHDHDECERERLELEREKSEKQTALTNYRAIPERIRQQELRMRDIQRIFQEVKARVLDIRSRQDQISIEKAEATLEYANAVDHLRVLHEELIQLKIRHIEAFSDVEILKDRNTEHRDRLEAKNDELKEAVQEVKTMSAAVKEMMKQANKVVSLSARQPDLAALLATLVDHTVDQLEADIDSEKARLELTHGGSSNIIKEFEEREKQIQKLRGKLSEFETQLAEFDHAINEIRGKWEPKLDEIIKSISDAFSDSFARIGCAGQVTLDKAEDEAGADGEPGGSDFDQWSIQIHVKFREHENLSLLDSHRQSGGERAVSTIFYLMALQSLSASPFRVVDEINQGMDPRNERMVHGRLVDIACAPSENGGGGQYFLITPKLLSGLVYKPGMRVLCIYSGEHMPKDYEQLDFGQAVQRMRAIRDRRAEDTTQRSNGHVDVFG